MKTKLAWLLVTLAFGASAQVYKWVDEKGQVHYGEQPPADAKTSTVKVPPAPPPDAQPDKPRADAAPPKEATAAPGDKATRCKTEKAQLDVLEKNPVVFTTNEKKEQVPLQPEQREEAKKKVREAIKIYCS